MDSSRQYSVHDVSCKVRTLAIGVRTCTNCVKEAAVHTALISYYEGVFKAGQIGLDRIAVCWWEVRFQLYKCGHRSNGRKHVVDVILSCGR